MTTIFREKRPEINQPTSTATAKRCRQEITMRIFLAEIKILDSRVR